MFHINQISTTLCFFLKDICGKEVNLSCPRPQCPQPTLECPAPLCPPPVCPTPVLSCPNVTCSTLPAIPPCPQCPVYKRPSCQMSVPSSITQAVSSLVFIDEKMTNMSHAVAGLSLDHVEDNLKTFISSTHNDYSTCLALVSRLEVSYSQLNLTKYDCLQLVDTS